MDLWEAYDTISEELGDNLFTIPPYPIVSGKKVKELLDALENPDPAWGGLEGEIIRMVSNPWQRAYQMEYRIGPSKIFEVSLKVIESATYDHMIGNYISSYLCLVPVVERSLRDWAEELKLETTNSRGYFAIFTLTKNLIIYLKDEFGKRNRNIRFQKWILNQVQYFEYIMRNVFFANFEDSKEGVKKEFNRNRTLHLLDGISDNLTLRDNNIRILLLIDIIAELYLALDDELYSENTFYSDPEENINFKLRWKLYLKNALEQISYTDMTILRFAFLEEDEEVSMSDERKLEFISRKELEISRIMKNV